MFTIKRIVPAVLLTATILGGTLFASTSAFAEQTDCSYITNAGTTTVTCVNPDGTVVTSTSPRSAFPIYPSAPAQAPFWTAITMSANSAPAAETQAQTLRSQGFDAQVLYSDYFSSLRPGYWVTYVGQYPLKAQAQSMADELHGLGYSDAYPREVSR